MTAPSPDHNPADFSTPQGRAREKGRLPTWWIVPGVIIGLLTWAGIFALIAWAL